MFSTPSFNVLQPFIVQQQYVTCLDGFQLPVTVFGQGKPVLMLHAFGMDARQFIPFLLPLAKSHCFYLPHLRGFGLSAATPTSEFDFIEQYTDDVEEVLTYICQNHHTSAIDVAAISMGALVMWAYFNRRYSTALQRENTLHAPNKVRRYFNIDQSPIVHNQSDWQGGVFGANQQLLFAQFQEAMSVILPYLNTQSPYDPLQFNQLPYPIKRKFIDIERLFSLISVERRHSKWIINLLTHQPDYKLALFNHRTWQQKLNGMQAYLQLPYDYREALANITTPTTMLIGGKSRLYDPSWQYRVCELMPTAKAIEIPHSGHAIPMDAPVAFINSLAAFLNED